MSMRSMRWIYSLAVATALVSPWAASGQESEFPYAIRSWTIRDVPTGIAYGSAVTGLYLLGQNRANRARTFTPADLASSGEVVFFDKYATRQWSDRWDSLSDQLLWGMGVATVASLSVVLSQQESSSGSVARKNTATLALMAAELLLLNKGFTDLVKGSVRRRRPYVHNQELSPEEKLRVAREEDDVFLSFFSGHSAVAFSAAAFVSTVVADATNAPDWAKGIVWGSTMSVAALTAYARVAAGRHFPSDVIVGAVVGAAIGHLVPRSHRLGVDMQVQILNRGYDGIGLGVRIPMS